MKRFISLVLCFLLLTTCASAELINQITPHTSSLLYNLPVISDLIELISQIRAKEFVTSHTYNPQRLYFVRKTVLANIFGQELVLDERIDSSPKLLP